MPDFSNINSQTDLNSSPIQPIIESDLNLNEARFSAPSNPLNPYLSYEQDVSVSSSQRENSVIYSGPKVESGNNEVVPHFYLSQLTRFATPRLKEGAWFSLNQVCNLRKEKKIQHTYFDIGINRFYASYASEKSSLLVDTIIGDLQPLVRFTNTSLRSNKNDLAGDAIGTQKILDTLLVYLENHRLHGKKTTHTLSNAPMKVVQDYVKYSIWRILSATA
ncbi:Hypothetical protein KP2612_000767 [Komagataella phaffii]